MERTEAGRKHELRADDCASPAEERRARNGTRPRQPPKWATALLAALIAIACSGEPGASAASPGGREQSPHSMRTDEAVAMLPITDGLDVVLAGARAQIGKTLTYDGSYERISYPGGDVPIERGVCTDVIVRAYRAAGIDLQVRVHEDMRKARSEYPKLWGLQAPDPNIDHRRVPNLQTYLRRNGQTLRISDRPDDYSPGDIVTWRLPAGPHIGLVSDRHVEGRPLVLHNIGAGARLEDMLFAFPITGHYRLPVRSPRSNNSPGGPEMPS